MSLGTVLIGPVRAVLLLIRWRIPYNFFLT